MHIAVFNGDVVHLRGIAVCVPGEKRDAAAAGILVRHIVVVYICIALAFVQLGRVETEDGNIRDRYALNRYRLGVGLGADQNTVPHGPLDIGFRGYDHFDIRIQRPRVIGVQIRHRDILDRPVTLVYQINRD
jgi:hypothetical protein